MKKEDLKQLLELLDAVLNSVRNGAEKNEFMSFKKESRKTYRRLVKEMKAMTNISDEIRVRLMELPTRLINWQKIYRYFFGACVILIPLIGIIMQRNGVKLTIAPLAYIAMPAFILFIAMKMVRANVQSQLKTLSLLEELKNLVKEHKRR